MDRRTGALGTAVCTGGAVAREECSLIVLRPLFVLTTAAGAGTGGAFLGLLVARGDAVLGGAALDGRADGDLARLTRRVDGDPQGQHAAVHPPPQPRRDEGVPGDSA